MKILYIDFSEGFEDLSIYPNRYGGAQIAPSWCRELLPDFYCLAPASAYTNITEKEKRNRCLEISINEIKLIRKGNPLKDFFNENEYDLVFHNSPDVFVNTKLPQCVWAPGFHEKVHPNHKYVLCHSPNFQHTQVPVGASIIPVQIGKPVPEFQEYEKEDFIFQCTNHAPCFQTITLAQLCKKHEIVLHLGGPVSQGYPLLDHVDNKYVFYHGIMKYQDKIEMTKRARAHTLLHTIPINFTLSGLEALAYGCALITTPMGFWPTFINNKIGRMIKTEEDFVRSWEEVIMINQKDCWEKAKEHDNIKMVNSFKNAFASILNT